MLGKKILIFQINIQKPQKVSDKILRKSVKNLNLFDLYNLSSWSYVITDQFKIHLTDFIIWFHSIYLSELSVNIQCDYLRWTGQRLLFFIGWKTRGNSFEKGATIKQLKDIKWERKKASGIFDVQEMNDFSPSLVSRGS